MAICLLNDRSFCVYVIWVLSLFLGMPFYFLGGYYPNSYFSKVGKHLFQTSEREFLEKSLCGYSQPCIQ